MEEAEPYNFELVEELYTLNTSGFNIPVSDVFRPDELDFDTDGLFMVRGCV